MMSLRDLILTAMVAAVVSVCPAVPVVTYSQEDLSRLLGEVVGERPTAKAKIRIHRNSAGTLLNLVLPSKAEALLHPTRQEKFPVSELVIDVFRLDNGQGVAQLAEDEGSPYPMLMVGTYEPIRGRGFDFAPDGSALMVAQKEATSLNTFDKPYFAKLSVANFEGKRLFKRRGDLVLVGNNTATGLVEARLISVHGPGNFGEAGKLNLQSVAVGVRVLDYSPEDDELLLGGVDAGGASSFAVYNLGNGQGRTVAPQRVGDTEAMFVKDKRLADRLQGRAQAAPEKGTFFGELFGGVFKK